MRRLPPRTTHTYTLFPSTTLFRSITAASASSAWAGMSLSLRGVARDVRFVTAHSRRGAALDIDWSSLARGGSTLAFYMGREAAGEIRRGLMQAGMPGEMPVMIACEVSGPGERRFVTRRDVPHHAPKSFASSEAGRGG